MKYTLTQKRIVTVTQQIDVPSEEAATSLAQENSAVFSEMLENFFQTGIHFSVKEKAFIQPVPTIAPKMTPA